VDLNATLAFLLEDGLVKGKGFWSQYAGQGKVSCTTTAICVYALAEMGQLAPKDKQVFQSILLAFRDQTGAFPRSTGGTPSTWTTAQATLALATIGAPWRLIKPSVEWLLQTQARNGGWNFPGDDLGHERLIYTFYPAIVLGKFRRRIGPRCMDAFTRIASFLESCDERNIASWEPLYEQIRRVVSPRGRHRRRSGSTSFQSYWERFEDAWPTEHVDEDWLAERFSMALVCGSNYLHLRHIIRPDDPLALLHIRYFADEVVGIGWNSAKENQPKIWATALGALTLDRWAKDFQATNANLSRLPTRTELFVRLQKQTGSVVSLSRKARRLIRQIPTLRVGIEDATNYQHWVRDVFSFLFGDVLKEPKLESRTFLGTQRRDITFRNAADRGPWFDWKNRHKVESLLVECKNTRSLDYEALRQTASYLGKRMGYLAIVACRRERGNDVWEILNWFVNNDDKHVIVVNDEILVDWIRLKDRGEDPTDAIADLYRWLREGAQ
jgi:hypothetical protein